MYPAVYALRGLSQGAGNWRRASGFASFCRAEEDKIMVVVVASGFLIKHALLILDFVLIVHCMQEVVGTRLSIPRRRRQRAWQEKEARMPRRAGAARSGRLNSTTTSSRVPTEKERRKKGALLLSTSFVNYQPPPVPGAAAQQRANYEL
jgi:hypothetical protein